MEVSCTMCAKIENDRLNGTANQKKSSIYWKRYHMAFDHDTCICPVKCGQISIGTPFMHNIGSE